MDSSWLANDAKTFEIHCWNEETEWIELALKYGTLQENVWDLGKVINGEITDEFIDMMSSSHDLQGTWYGVMYLNPLEPP